MLRTLWQDDALALAAVLLPLAVGLPLEARLAGPDRVADEVEADITGEVALAVDEGLALRAVWRPYAAVLWDGQLAAVESWKK